MPEKKLHHHVPQFLHQAWSDRDHIWCLQSGEIFHPNIKNLVAENHFYRRTKLSREDFEFVREAAIKDSPAWLKPHHEKLLKQFTSPHSAKEHFEKSGTDSPDLMASIERDIAEANANFPMSIEETFKPQPELLCRGDLSAYASNTFVAGRSFQWG
jgi:hypothetical protein